MTRYPKTKMLFEFTDGYNTYAVYDHGRYVEILLVLANYDKKERNTIIEVGGNGTIIQEVVKK